MKLYCHIYCHSRNPLILLCFFIFSDSMTVVTVSIYAHKKIGGKNINVYRVTGKSTVTDTTVTN